MELDTQGHLKSARELIEKAAEQVSKAKDEPLFSSDLVRQSALDEIDRIRLKMSFMRRDLMLIAGVAKRRYPRSKKRNLHRGLE
jgi:hypothetical protein